jgi:hypothetical protein
VQALLEEKNIPRAALAVDFKNAFNERRRDEILTVLLEESKLQSMWRLAHWAYSASTPLLTIGDSGNYEARLQSRQGVRQGDPLGSLLFDLSMKHIYAQVRAEVPDVHAFAIHDDLTFVGAPNKCHFCLMST